MRSRSDLYAIVVARLFGRAHQPAAQDEAVAALKLTKTNLLPEFARQNSSGRKRPISPPSTPKLRPTFTLGRLCLCRRASLPP